MKIDLLFLSCNRLHYTKLSLPALLSDPTEEFSLTIWDNGSKDGTREFLKSVEDPRIVKKVLSKENVGGYCAINETLKNSSGDFIGFVSDDLLVTPGWIRTLGTAHAEVPEFGKLSCWHFALDKFDYERAKHKIQIFGRHKVLRHPWTNGCGLCKRKILREVGPMRAEEGESRYWLKVALRGYVNGYYYPLIPVEHMDYPWSKYYAFSDRIEEGIAKGSTYKKRGIRTLEDAKAWHQVVLGNILDDPWDVKYYIGWRKKLRGLHRRVDMFVRRFQ